MTSENQPVRAGKFSRKDVSYTLYVNNSHEKNPAKGSMKQICRHGFFNIMSVLKIPVT